MKLGKLFVEIGIAFILIGILAIFMGKAHIRLFHLPGDIVIKKDGLTIYIPITTSILLSLLLTLVLSLLSKK